MPRAPRVHFPSALFHVMARGNAGQKIFLDLPDYHAFLEILSKLKQRTPFLLYSYCLMPNHIHLLAEVHRHPLSVIMQRLLTQYSKRFNFRHRRRGHLFQGRYKAILCQKDSYLQELIRYLHLNPVRAKLAEELPGWSWSSHQEYVRHKKGGLVDTSFPLSMFHSRPSKARELYAQFVRDGIQTGHRKEYYPAQTLPCLGDDTFLSDYRALLDENDPQGKASRKQPLSLERLAAQRKGTLELDVFLSRSRAHKITAARHEFVLRALQAGHRPSAIASFLRCSPSAVSKIISRRL